MIDEARYIRAWCRCCDKEVNARVEQDGIKMKPRCPHCKRILDIEIED